MPPVYGVDPRDLSSSGWGVIFSPGIQPDIRRALRPLLELRYEQAGQYYREYELSEEEDARSFLLDLDVGFGPADPEKVPYYILIVGDPRVVPYQFQYDLDVQYAVGRLHFNRIEEYAIYAESVVASEVGRVSLPRDVALFGAQHDGDKATERLLRGFLSPIASRLERDCPSWSHSLYIKERATKDQLRRLIGGPETPAFLLTANHGAVFPKENPLQAEHQGSLICHGPSGPAESWDKAELRENYLSADDVPDDADVRGLMMFLFTCYGVGTPEYDNFPKSGKIHRLAHRPFISRLVQRLLSHPRGSALAVVGHVDRTWSSSFELLGRIDQTRVFSDFIRQLLDGYPVGHAVEYINQRHADVAIHFLNLVLADEVDNEEFYGVLKLNNDARNYIIIGDPAVRLATT